MKSRISSSHVVFTALIVGLLSACSRLPTLRFDPPFGYAEWVETRDAQVIVGAKPALAVNFRNLKEQEITVRIEIDEIDGDDDCVDSFGLGPGEETGYFCRQRSVAAGKRYLVELRVYKDFGETEIAERRQRRLEIRRDEDGGLILEGRPLE